MKTLKKNGGEELISIKLQFFYMKKGIVIKYVALYLYKENNLAKQRWQILMIIKDSILIDSRLPNNV